jgi:hypothetical protein
MVDTSAMREAIARTIGSLTLFPDKSSQTTF